MLLCKTALKFDGLNLKSVRAYYTYHIKNNMCIAVVEIYFEYILDNGGGKINIFFKYLKVSKFDRERLLVRIVLLLKIK